MSNTVSQDWILGAFGVLVMVFFIGCTSCWQFFTEKSPDSAGPRQAPPPPTPDRESRYEFGLYPPPPQAAAQHSGPKIPIESEEDSEEDFEEVRILNTAQQSHVNAQNSDTFRTSAEENGACQDTYANLALADGALDYVNFTDGALGGLTLSEERIYVKIIDSDLETEKTAEDKTKEEHRTPRSAINSIGKSSSHSDSLCHSYENVAVGSPPSGSDIDYVNMTAPLAV